VTADRSIAAADETGVLDACATELWERLQRREPYYRSRSGSPIEQLPTASLVEAEQESDAGARIAATLETIDRTRLAAADEVTADFLLHMAGEARRAREDWWDSFPVTPYMAIVGLSAHLRHVFMPFAFTNRNDQVRYLSLLSDYRDLVRNSAEKMRMLAAREWRVARPAIAGARKTIAGLRASAAGLLIPEAARLVGLGNAAAQARDDITRLVESEIVPAIHELSETLDDDYARLAPEAPGLLHMPGGSDAYARAVQRHLTEPVSAEALHQLGRQEVARITDAMAELRASNGWTADEAAFHDELRRSPRSYANSAEEVGARYQQYIDRMTAALPSLFRTLPSAPFRIVRLAAEAEAGMAYGYYEGPAQAGGTGTYYYNGSNLAERPQLTAACLILHELVPGHHFHLARQVENVALPAIRRESGELSVFNEGWAEYASSLGMEAGVYDDPVDLYGRLLHERFIAQRLVVDTGLNAFGWTLDEATTFMRAQTLERDEQIASELLRYATDWPAQSLAYHYGRVRFQSMRERAAILPGFDIRDFHEAILSEGALPLQTLDRHLARTFGGNNPGGQQ
jgi:uncharacterized protein (DUF885 family)